MHRSRARIGIAAVVAVVATVLVAPLSMGSVAADPQQAPIGPPGEEQYPFVCTTTREGLGQPLVDNQDGQGIPVVSESTPGPNWATTLSGVSGGDAGRPFPNRDGYPDLGYYKQLGLVAGSVNSFAELIGADQPAWLLGHSRDCRLNGPTIEYLYLSNSRADDPATPWVIEGNWRNLTNPNCAALPDDMVYLDPGVQVALDDPRNVITERTPFIIRRERGEINRFLYSIAALAPCSEAATTPITQTPSTDLWNGRVAFHFGGGVGIGHFQGRINGGNSLYTQELQRGYAVLYSTGTASSFHYNLLLGGRTAVQTKAHFVSVYGEPTYTVGVGGSGGGIQQYVYGQNHPGLLDGGVPQYAYPDMVTQTIHIGDCELLEHYFEKTDRTNPRWSTVENRIPVMGLNAETAPTNKSGSGAQWWGLYRMYEALGYRAPIGGGNLQGPALTECRAAWTGLTPSAMNPSFQTISAMDRIEGYDLSEVEFTHWADAAEAYGVDEDGWTRVPWGNEGIQYGLRALTEGRLTPAEFLRLNALIGSWKNTGDQVPEGVPFSLAAIPGINVTAEITKLLADARDPAKVDQVRADFDPWSSRNMRLSPDGVTPAPRRAGDPIAIRNAVETGHVFSGITPGTTDPVDIPFIDWRHYLERELDMHNTHQSFAVRQRIINAQGNYDNHLVWFTDGRPRQAWDQTPQAFDVLERWITTMKANPSLTAGQARAALLDNNWDDRIGPLTDACFSTQGQLQYAGDDAWDGILNDEDTGRCLTEGDYTIYTSSRIEAGAPITGDVFGCGASDLQAPLISVEEAAARGFYGLWQPSAAQLDRLREIFPTGVCDFPNFYAPGEAPNPPQAGFTDINDGGWYGPGLRWATALGVTTGTSPTTFNPFGNVTRGQMAAFLWRFVGEPRSSTNVPFTDVGRSVFYYDALRWMVENELTTVSGQQPTYRPTSSTNRAQVVTFLYRLAGEPSVDGVSMPFTDVRDDAYFRDAVAWAADLGITTGKTPTSFAPLAPVSRAELVTFLFRARELRAADPCLIPTSEVGTAVC